MAVLSDKLESYIENAINFEKHTNAALETGLTAEQHKQTLSNRTEAEGLMRVISDQVFGARKFEGESDYQENYLLPILKKFETSSEYITENVELLKNFANSLSGLRHYKSIAKATDRPAAVIVYKALLNNAMKGNNLEEQIVLTRDLAMCLNNFVGYALQHEAVKYLNKLFEKIPETDFGNLSPQEREAYAWCKYVWAASHFNNPNCDFETLDSAVDVVENFYKDAKKFDSEVIPWAAFENQLVSARMQIGVFCEFGRNATMSMEHAEKYFTYTQQHMDQETWDAFANDDERLQFLRKNVNSVDNGSEYIAWAELAHKTGKCNMEQLSNYLQFLLEISKKTMAEPLVEDNHLVQGQRLQVGITATAVLCKYYDEMSPTQKCSCERNAKQCMQWMADSPVKWRSVFANLGMEIKTVWDVATVGLSKREKALALLRLTTESTYAHSTLNADMAVDLAKSLIKKYPEKFEEMFPGLTEEEMLEEIYVASLLHDIGKLEVSGPTSQAIRQIFEEEFGQLKTHPLRALKYLTDPEFACARACAVWHHVDFDGKGGYPIGEHEYIDPEAEKFHFLAQLKKYVDCYTSALDKYKPGAWQLKNKPANIVAELAALSKPEAYDKFPKKAEGRIIYDPIFSEIVASDPELFRKYTSDEYLDTIEKRYDEAENIFRLQPNNVFSFKIHLGNGGLTPDDEGAPEFSAEKEPVLT